MYLTKYPKIIKIGSQTKKLWPFEVGQFSRKSVSPRSFVLKNLQNPPKVVPKNVKSPKNSFSFSIFTFSWKGVCKNNLVWVNLIKNCTVKKYLIFDFFIFSWFFRSILIVGAYTWGTTTRNTAHISFFDKKNHEKMKKSKI